MIIGIVQKNVKNKCGGWWAGHVAASIARLLSLRPFPLLSLSEKPLGFFERASIEESETQCWSKFRLCDEREEKERTDENFGAVFQYVTVF
jgi:hypothetical protein